MLLEDIQYRCKSISHEHSERYPSLKVTKPSGLILPSKKINPNWIVHNQKYLEKSRNETTND